MLFGLRLVVTFLDVLGDLFVEMALQGMLILPSHRNQFGLSGVKQRFAFAINGDPLFSADHKGLNPLLGHRADIWESLSIQKRHQAMEGITFALMGSGGKQQQVGGGFGQSLTQLVAGDLIGTAAEPMCFVNDDQIPSRGQQIIKS